MAEEETRKIDEITLHAGDLDVGGNFIKRFRPDEMIQNGIRRKEFIVKAYRGYVETKFGNRPEWTITDDFDEYLLTSWSFVTKEKFKATDLVGKRIVLISRDEKRAELQFVKD